MIIEKIKHNYLAVTGILIPFAVTILVIVIVSMSPYDTAEEKWEKAGGSLLAYAPIVAVFFGAILVGINTVIRDNQTESDRNEMSAFLFSFIWTSVFLTFATLYFMQYMYIKYGGLKL